MTDEYALHTGRRIRAVRRYQRRSLRDVFVLSDGEFHESVLGAYERGERQISLARLNRLADLYRVPITWLIPDDRQHSHNESAVPNDSTREFEGDQVVLSELHGATSPETVAVARVVAYLTERRDHHDNPVFALRASDLDMIAVVLGLRPAVLRNRLRIKGVLR